MQHFLTQNVFEDGQASTQGRPDRAESDSGDNELSDSEDSDTPARTATPSKGSKPPGTPDSLEEFLADYDDTADAGQTDAPAAPPKVPTPKKRPREEAGTSRQQAGKGQGPSKKAKATPAAVRLEETALNIPPLRYRMPSFPTVAGYVLPLSLF